MSLILDYEMVEHFGGPVGGAGVVSEVEFQRHLLCYEARHHAEAELSKNPPENAPSASSGDTTVTNTTRRKRAPLVPAE